MKLGKSKGQNLQSLAAIGITFIVITLILSFGAQILSGLQADQVTGATGCNATSKANCGADYNTTTYGLTSLQDMGSWLPTVALVVIAAVIIGIVVTFLGRRQ